MRGRPDPQSQIFFVIDVESRIRPNHPLRPLKKRVDAILRSMDALFAQAYDRTGRPSVPPERLLKAMLLMALYSLRSERQLCERIDTDLLFRWFLDMSPEEAAFDLTVFTYNRPRMDQFGITAKFFEAVLEQAIGAGLCSDDHFTVDGTIIDSYASMKSFRPKDEDPSDDSDGSNSFKPRNPSVDFHGKKRSNETHASRTDPEARLYCKGRGQASRLAHLGHVLSENRNGLIVETCVTEANGTAERDAAIAMIQGYKQKHGRGPKTVGADAGYDAGEFLIRLEQEDVIPHVAMRSKEPTDPATARGDRKAGIEARVRMRARQQTIEYVVSQRVRKRVEECFGWCKTIAGLDRSHWVGRWKLQQYFDVAASAYNLLRLTKLQPTS
ncbi:IS5 family transposase [Blastopirellula sp. J2-11]|uniref:IS5 family transposase n=1 Tax=Blastopirellula sp. J2-11 TaxID=2943192 RepID=UPI0021C6B0E4|nr:IS5 family transposase [Blastopirellula sp. J2-11]UUO07873.1 IS5 family transposase [Blastopirellula sp. J2-11]